MTVVHRSSLHLLLTRSFESVIFERAKNKPRLCKTLVKVADIHGPGHLLLSGGTIVQTYSGESGTWTETFISHMKHPKTF